MARGITPLRGLWWWSDDRDAGMATRSRRWGTRGRPERETVVPQREPCVSGHDVRVSGRAACYGCVRFAAGWSWSAAEHAQLATAAIERFAARLVGVEA